MAIPHKPTHLVRGGWKGVSSQAVNRADCCKCPASASRLEFPTRALSLPDCSVLRSQSSIPFCFGSYPIHAPGAGPIVPINASSFAAVVGRRAEKRENNANYPTLTGRCQPSQSPSIVPAKSQSHLA